MYLAESTLHMLSKDSRCRMWDRQANGYARGEGCGVVVLKSLSKALADHDLIECVIRETAINSDGRTNGITMPSAEAQAALIRKTYAQAGLDPVTDGCQYFECHGTGKASSSSSPKSLISCADSSPGTQAGDPVEARAIQEAFFPDQQSHKQTPLYCGSVKTVIGHLEGGAGLAGLLKASLAIQNKTIPPNMHFTHLSPAVEPYYGHLCVPTSALPWPETNGQPLRASVNSFGFGGTNCHLILESYHESSETSSRQQLQENCEDNTEQLSDEQGEVSSLFVFSAKSPASLLGNLSKFAEYIKANTNLDLESLSRILYSRRSTFAFRTTIVASSRDSLLEALQERVLSAEPSGSSRYMIRSSASGRMQQPLPGILGVFTGQVCQPLTEFTRWIARFALFANESLTSGSTVGHHGPRDDEALNTIPPVA